MTRFRRILSIVVLTVSAVASATAQPRLRAHIPVGKQVIQQSHFRATHSLTSPRAVGRVPGADAASAAPSAARNGVLHEPTSAGMRGVVGLHTAASIGGATSARGSFPGHGAASIDGRTMRRRLR
jgi:hypothetical protein